MKISSNIISVRSNACAAPSTVEADTAARRGLTRNLAQALNTVMEVRDSDCPPKGFLFLQASVETALTLLASETPNRKTANYLARGLKHANADVRLEMGTAGRPAAPATTPVLGNSSALDSATGTSTARHS